MHLETVSLYEERTDIETSEIRDFLIGYADVPVDKKGNLPTVISFNTTNLGIEIAGRTFVQDLRISPKIYVEKTFDWATNFRKEK